MRKKRKDRNHIIYKLTNEVTNETYIGVTVVTGRAYLKSLRSRWIRHIYKATKCLAEYPISESIRTYGEESFHREIIEIVRGKSNAFEREAELINEYRPSLNTRMQQ
mgnify:FL=1|jgi:hypothetical protein